MVRVAVEPVLCGRNEQLMISTLRFPTEFHREVAELAVDFFSAHAHVDTILVVNSCARGRAVAGSDLDLAVLIVPTAASQEVQCLTTLWQEFVATHPLIHRFRSTGRFTQVHLDVFDGRMAPTVWDDGAARTISKWRSAIASRMPPRSIKWGSTFDSFSRSGCLTTGMISNGVGWRWCARHAPGIWKPSLSY